MTGSKAPSPKLSVLSVSELKKWSFYRALIAEYVATILYLYIPIAAIVGQNNQLSDPCDNGVGLLGISWAFGGMNFLLVYCTAGISGGHINPAVTLGQLVAKKVTLVRAVAYMVSQCLGAICGVLLVKAIMPHQYEDTVWGGGNAVVTGYSKVSALIAETIGTSIIVYTFFSATDDESEDDEPDIEASISPLCPLAIGFSVFVVHLAQTPITGAGINPARSFATAVVYNDTRVWDDQWIFWLGPCFGAILAAIYYQCVHKKGVIKAVASFASDT